ncbi:MAG: CvpA family protein [Anaerovoracaceae bacterium]
MTQFVKYFPDVFLALIVIWAIINGHTKGFVRTLIHAISWVLSVFVGIIFSPLVQTWLMENTPMYDKIKEALALKFQNSLPLANSTFSAMPKVLSEGIHNVTGTITEALATRGADIIFSVLSFVFIVILVKLALFIIAEIFSGKSRSTFTGFVDGFLGIVLGAVGGMFIVLLLLAFLVPLITLSNEGFSQVMINIINESYVTKYLYYNNPLVYIFQIMMTKLF